jgi:hypothetical protein
MEEMSKIKINTFSYLFFFTNLFNIVKKKSIHIFNKFFNHSNWPFIFYFLIEKVNDEQVIVK